jgi:XTP/dITP diphosphohydrolase
MNQNSYKGRLLLATNNPHKISELSAILIGLEGIDVLTPKDLGIDLDVEEEGKSYAQNATLKALAFARAGNMITLADDSGLEVEVLNGEPGIYSARYSGKPGASDADRRHYLLQKLKDKPKPWTALFRCVIAIAAPLAVIQNFEGVCLGEIIEEERGSNGFGYDPIFLISGGDKTMAELDSQVKNEISHRGRAAAKAAPFLHHLLRKE